MPTKKKTPTGGGTKKQATTLSPTKTRKQLNKEKADMIRAGYGAKQPTARDARKGRKATKKTFGKMSKSSSKATKKITKASRITKKGVRSGGACGSSPTYSGTGGVCRNKKTMKKYR